MLAKVRKECVFKIFLPLRAMKNYLRYLLAFAGILSLLLGVIGIFIPILPTTPFILLAAWLFLRSSTRLHQKLMTNHYFGPMVMNYQVHKAIPVRAKIYSLSMLWICILFSSFFFTDKWWLRILLCAIATGVTIHILSFKTLKKMA